MCYKEFISESNLKKHVTDFHEKKSAVKCDICSTSVCGKKVLIEHFKNAHGDVERKK